MTRWQFLFLVALVAGWLLSLAAGPALAALPGASPDSANSAFSATQGNSVAPKVVPLQDTPADVAAGGKLLTTPRARVVLGARVSDPREVVDRSGRRRCVFSLRSMVAGIVEFLFPGTDFFRRGAPLFRIYDPGVLADLTAAEQAMRGYEVRPLVIARTSRAGEAAVRGEFPSPTTRPRALRIARLSPQAGVASQVVQPPVETAAPASLADEPSSAPAPKPRTSLKPAPAPPPLPKVDLGPYRDAVADARASVSRAQQKLAQAQEDFDAKKKLVDLGALAQDCLDESAARLADATIARADAEARLATAQDLLSAQEKRAAQAASAAKTAAQVSDVQVMLGSGQEPQTPGANRVARAEKPAPRVQMESGVEVIRGIPQSEGPRRARPVSYPDPPVNRKQSAPPAPTQARPAATTTIAAVPWIPTEESGRSESLPRAGSRHSASAEGEYVTSRFRPLPLPKELDRLSEQRWTEYQAPADGFVLARSASGGQLVQAGQEIMRVVNTQWAVVYMNIRPEDVDRFDPGTIATVSFDDYPGVQFEGWINDVRAEPGSDHLRAEIVVFCKTGYYGTDAVATLQWLALATPLDQNGDPHPLEPVIIGSPDRQYDRDPLAGLSLVPRGIWALGVPDEALERSESTYEGQLQITELEASGSSPVQDPEARKRLETLKRWREGFVEGMVRTQFDQGVVLTYPKSGEIRRAIERMATGRVSSVPNRCARTMREALGWGLGDAHVWARLLPGKGYIPRADGLARPGDILVWPFTYPPRGTQHIGIAVQQNGRLMLLSNLSGTLGTVPIQPGYLAFYKPL
ncbi:MAG: HlyD family efflux transporter periplasmic adaptor subunit [Armatimonadetes bacterium]|nr:HlyD family efflux transporter periplasmic adaptor subunit [Armatimonadota bacterium]